MSELRPDSPTVSTPLQSTPVAVAEPADPFLSLHKMSTTAGLGSGDYVAINGNAIAAVLLGIASAFVLMGTNLLLILPAAGIICAILAFRQITDSNGTQTGGGLAALGLVLSLGFGGFFTGREAIVGYRNHADSEQIVDLIHRLGQDIQAKDYTGAYALFDQRFQARISEIAFAGRWMHYDSLPIGHITGMDWTELLEFDNNVVTGEREATGQVLVSFAKIPGKDRQAMVFRKVNGKWCIFDAPTMFPPIQPAAPGAAGASRPNPAVSPPAGSPVQGPPVPTTAR